MEHEQKEQLEAVTVGVSHYIHKGVSLNGGTPQNTPK